MGSDSDPQIRIKSDDQLKDIDKKYPGFIQSKAQQGVKMSYKLQELLQKKPLEPIRGVNNEQTPGALNAFLYTLIRGNSASRRALLQSMLNMFDDSAVSYLTYNGWLKLILF
jgi:cohesin loading factor subunit SCC2